MQWQCSDRTFDLSREGIIMGILNVTPDSFSDGGRFQAVTAAIELAGEMLDEGAKIIDIGGESTRPGAAMVSEEKEKERVIPVIKELRQQFPDICISIDTTKVSVAREALAAGAKVINDISGFSQIEMILLAAETGAGIVAMHMRGTPRTMQDSPAYENVTREVLDFFQQRYDDFLAAGIAADTIVFDPGIGFGKILEHNLQLLRDLGELSVGGRPLLLGASRKSFIGKVLNSDKMEDRSAATVAITASAREKGVMIHRVHEVKANWEALRMTEAILRRKALGIWH